MSAWLRINGAAEYAAVSSKTIQRWMARGLKHSSVGGAVLIRKTWIDDFIEAHTRTDLKQAESIAATMIKELEQ